MTQQINLYEARLRPRRELVSARNVGLSALILLMLMVVLSGYARQEADKKSAELADLLATVRGEQERMNDLSKVVAGRRVSPALQSEQARTQALLAAQQEVMAVLDSGRLGNTSGFSEFMYGFARQSQSDLWLTGFTVSTGGEEIEIRGRLFDAAKLPGYVQRLSAEKVFQGRRFATLEMRSIEPEALSAPATSVSTAGAPVAQVAAPQSPRYVEFLLRSAGASSVGAESSLGKATGAVGGMGGSRP